METSTVRSTGGGFKMQYHGVDKKRNEVGGISSVKSVVEVKTVSQRCQGCTDWMSVTRESLE